MQILKLENAAQAKKIMEEIGVTVRGTEIMADKAVLHTLRLEHVDTRAANILKQTMLSNGAEAAVSGATINLSEPYTDVLLMATTAQLRASLPRLYEQPWGLKKLAAELEVFLQQAH